MNSVQSICDNFESTSDNVKNSVLLYGDSRFDEVKNRFILEATVTYIKDTERFFGYLFVDKIINNVLPQKNHSPTSYLCIHLFTLAMYLSILISPRQD